MNYITPLALRPPSIHYGALRGRFCHVAPGDTVTNLRELVSCPTCRLCYAVFLSGPALPAPPHYLPRQDTTP